MPKRRRGYRACAVQTPSPGADVAIRVAPRQASQRGAGLAKAMSWRRDFACGARRKSRKGAAGIARERCQAAALELPPTGLAGSLGHEQRLNSGPLIGGAEAAPGRVAFGGEFHPARQPCVDFSLLFSPSRKSRLIVFCVFTFSKHCRRRHACRRYRRVSDWRFPCRATGRRGRRRLASKRPYRHSGDCQAPR